MSQPSHSFTLASKGGLMHVLRTECHVSQAFNPIPGGASPPMVPFEAIWDTGATASVITQIVITKCGLKPIGMCQVHGVNSTSMCEVYLVNIVLPNAVGFANVRVTKSELPGGSDMLIGMDIITQGDFAVTNKGGQTVFSFRVPSQEHKDYVKDHAATSRRETMTHGGSRKDRKRRKKEFGKNKS